jgi:hypothetical protein
MNVMNCKKGLRVKIISKSIGQDVGDLNNIEEAVIDEFRGHYLMVETITKYGNEYRYKFLPQDLTPLWEENK